MMPRVIIHNSVSLDNALTGFDIDLGVHYGALLTYKPDAVLTGADTVLYGVEMFLDEVPPEEERDLTRPPAKPDDSRPIEVIVDSRGRLPNLLHIFRRSEHVKDVLVLVSDRTPEEYLDYLEEREYPFIRCGSDHVDLRAALEILRREYGVSTVVSDSGSLLSGVLIREKIAGELSLLVVPVLAGTRQKKLFESVETPVDLTFNRSERLENGIMHLMYTVQ
ncbi:MAG: RibD family protein [Methanomicrobiaceae archaeon]|nr:RibD family protein [Methanomicrobiaceae archaeon]